MNIKCDACFHGCLVSEGKTGLCRARLNNGKEIVCDNYGLVTSIALDAIEKKPLMMFHRGSRILSVGSYGCNLSCPFCQNSSISASEKKDNICMQIMPEELVKKAEDMREQGNIGIAYTYNEPLIGYEFVRDTAKLAREKGLKNVVVTNGCFTEKVLNEIIPYIDAMNIDLKGFTNEYYKMVGGDLDMVKNFIKKAYEKGCHIELTTLLVPDCNDTDEDIEAMAAWIAGVDPNIPYHISRFFPQWKMSDKQPTKIESVRKAVEIARKHLKNLYTGNV